MFSHIFRPRGPVAVQSPRQDSGSKTRNTIYSDKRTSTGSEVSITDVEAGFLAGQRSKREQWKNTLLLNALLAKLRRTPSNDSDPDGKPSKRSRRPFCTNILLGVVLLGVYVNEPFLATTLSTPAC